MIVYVDDMYWYEIGKFGRMKMLYFIVDMIEELFVMVCEIGVNLKWIQYLGMCDEYFDIVISKCVVVIVVGVILIIFCQCGVMNKWWKVIGLFGFLDDVVEWFE